MRANYIIAKTGGKAKIILTTHSDFISTTLEQDEYKKVLATCSGCETVATVNIAAGDLGTPAVIQQKVATVLQQHPEATVFVSSSDTVLGMIGQTLRQNNNPKLIVVASEGYANTLDLMRQGFSTAGGDFSQEWGAWAAVDTLNRIFAGGESATIPDSGMNMQMIDKDHGLDKTMGTGYVHHRNQRRSDEIQRSPDGEIPLAHCSLERAVAANQNAYSHGSCWRHGSFR